MSTHLLKWTKQKQAVNQTAAGTQISLKVAPQKGSAAICETIFKQLAHLAQTVSTLPNFLSWVIMFGVFDKLQQAGILQFNQEVSPV